MRPVVIGFCGGTNARSYVEVYAITNRKSGLFADSLEDRGQEVRPGIAPLSTRNPREVSSVPLAYGSNNN